VRIISGQWKGLRLVAPPGHIARPTTDRVKESIFNLMGFDWSGQTVVDLFAGSGALGLEALSRGADEAILVDKNKTSIRTVRENVEKCHAQERAQVWALDWSVAWHRISQLGASIGWVFVDPPYSLNLWESVLRVISQSELSIHFGIVCEHPKHIRLPDEQGTLHTVKQKCYGDICVTIYRDYSLANEVTK
jgi:16S rRNA (guanine966-N2)-methyltransferase